MRKFKNLLVELLAAFILVSGILVVNPQTVFADAVSLNQTDVTVKLEKEAYYYTGEEITPSIMYVSYVDGGKKVMIDDTDYNFEYSENTNVGNGKVIVTGTNVNYTFEKAVNFTINPVDLTSVTNFSVKFVGGATSFKWNKDGVKPEVESISFVAGTQNITLPYKKEGGDFDVEYSNNTGLGAGTVTITGKTDNCTGSNTGTFSIVRKPATPDENHPHQLATDLVYNGTNQQLITLPYQLIAEDNCVNISYTFGTQLGPNPGGMSYTNYTELVAKNAGTYHIWAKLTPQDSNCGYDYADIYLGQVEIAKANYSYTTAQVNSFTYNGLNQLLLNKTEQVIGLAPGEVNTDGATKTPGIDYTIGTKPVGTGLPTDTPYPDTNAPTTGWTQLDLKKKDAGIYHIWYSITADDSNHNSVPATYLGAAKIEQAAPVISISNLTLSYSGGALQIAPATVTLKAGDNYSEMSNWPVVYTYYTDDACKSEVPQVEGGGIVTAGKYYVKATLVANGNYTAGVSNKATFIINKVASNIETYPQAIATDYNGADQMLVSAGSVTGGVLQYALTDLDKEPTAQTQWSSNIPTGKNVGGYRVWYRVIGDENHTDISQESIPVYINRQVVPVPVIHDFVYDGTEHTSGLVVDDRYEIVPGTDLAHSNHGAYSVKVALKDDRNYVWSTDVEDYKAYDKKYPSYEATIKEIDYTINTLDLSNATVTLKNNGNVQYTGSQVTPEIESIVVRVVTNPGAPAAEQQFVDVNVTSGYTVEYHNNINVKTTAATQPSITIKAISGSNFSGEKTVDFTIVPKPLSSDDITLSLSKTNYVWENAEIKPEITVKNAGKTLTKEVDYTVSYSNNTNVGQATITVTGKSGSNYSDSKTYNFNITQLTLEDITVKYVDDNGDTYESLSGCFTQDFTYTGYAIKPQIILEYKQGDGTAQFVYDPVNGSDYFTVTAYNSTNYTKRYTTDGPVVGAPAYIDITLTNDNTSKETVRKEFHIIPKSLESAGIDATVDTTTIYTWNGNPHEAAVTVKDNNRIIEDSDESLLVEDTNYTVTYVNNVVAGTNTAKAVIQGIGNYTGSITKTFSIKQYAVQADDIIITEDSDRPWVYDGNKHEPVVSVYYNNKQTKLADNFVNVTYINNTNAGTAKVKVEITSPNCIWDSTNCKTFVIAQKDIATSTTYSYTTTNNTLNFEWCGKDIKPIFKITDNGRTLIKGTDYDVTFAPTSEFTSIGEHEASVTFKGNYKNSSATERTTLKYNITKINAATGILIYDNNKETPDYLTNESPWLTSLEYTGFKTSRNFDVKYNSVVDTEQSKVNYSEGLNVTGLVDGDGNPTDPYEVTYENNENAGVATVTITFPETNPHIVGTKVLYYTITQRNVHGNVKITRNDGLAAYVWKNAAYTPDITVTDNVIKDKDDNTKYRKLVVNESDTSKKDFKVEFSNNTNVGTATITITGNGNYTGTTTETFTIRELKHTDLAFTYTPITEGGEVFNYGTHTVTPKLTYVTGTGNDGEELSNSFYDCVFSENTAGSGIDPISGEQTERGKVTITLKDPTNKNTDNSSKDYYFAISQKDLTNLDSVTYTTKNNTNEFAWCGEDIIPTFVIKDGDVTLELDTSYSLTAWDLENDQAYVGEHKEPGTYYYKATFSGNYKGYKILSYTIRKLTIARDIKIVEWANTDAHQNQDITNYTLSNSTYTGSEIYKDVELQYLSTVSKDTNGVISYSNYKKLDGVDAYEPIYENNLNASHGNPATIVLRVNSSTPHIDISDSKDIVNLSFTIEPKALFNNVTVTRKDATTVSQYAWRGSAYTPEITVTDNDIITTGTTHYVLSDNEYTVDYTNNTNPGTATITVIANEEGNYTGNTSISFTIHNLRHEDLDFSYTPAASQIIYNYEKHEVLPILKYKANTGNSGVQLSTDYYTYNFVNNTNATNSTNKAYVEVTLKGQYTTCAMNRYEFVINPKDISNSMQIAFVSDPNTSLEIEDYNWCGSEVKPVVIVSDGTDHPLTRDVDYTVSFENNTDITDNDSKAKVIVTGIGNYSGSKSKEFNIVPIDANDLLIYNASNGILGTEVKNNKLPEETFCASAFSKEFILRYYSTTDDSGSSINYKNLLTIDNTGEQSYTVEYEDNVHAGEAKVKIKFNSTETRFTGTRELTFTINPKSISGDVLTVSQYDSEYPWQNADIKPVPVVKVGTATTLVSGVDYTLSYENNKDVGVNTANIVITGKGDYKDTKKVPFSIRKITFDDVNVYTKIGDDITLANGASNNLLEDFTYNGAVAKPNIVLKFKSNDLVVPNDNYEVNYYNSNIDVTAGQTAKITLKFINDDHTVKTLDKVQKDCFFKIVPRDISNVIIASDSISYPYTGAAIVPTFTVTDFNGTKTLSEGTDFTYDPTTDLTNNIDVTSAGGNIKITGRGNYTGTTTGKFYIRKLSFDDLDVEYKADSSTYKPTIKISGVDFLDQFTYDRTKHEPEIKISSHVVGNILGNLPKNNEAGADGYQVTYYGDTENVGNDSYVIIKLVGPHFEGEKKYMIKIVPKDITEATFSITEPTYGYSYNGKPIEPIPTDTTVKAGDITLTEEDYIITYTDNIEISSESNKPTITITGIGNFCGSKSKEFTISNATTIDVSQEIDGDILIASNNEYYINNLLANDLSKVVLTINGTTRTYVNTVTKQDISKVGDYSVVIPYSKFVDINKNLEKDSQCIKVDLQVITPGETTEQDYTSTRSFDGIQTTRGIERLDVGQILANQFTDSSTSIYVDGEKLNKSDGIYQVVVYDGKQRTIQTYTYNDTIQNLGNDRHKQYSNGTRVYTIDQDTTGHAVVNELTGLQNALSYAGTSIRVAGKHGVRFFTSISKTLNDQLKSVSGVDGYKAVEYGTVAGYANRIIESGNTEPKVALNENNQYAGITRTAKATAYTINGGGTYYSQTSTTLTYSNPIVETNNGDFNDVLGDDFAVRAYMILRPVNAANGDTSRDIVIYTGTIYRSISYVATQVLNDYAVGSANYNYVNSLIQR